MSGGSRDAVLPGGEPLLAHVRGAASGAIRLRFALGYLYLAGLSPVWDALEASGAEVHLLIGNTAGQPTDEQWVAGQEAEGLLASALDVAAAARAERTRVVAETAEALRANLTHMPHSPENERLLVGLARSIAGNRLRVRIYPDGRLHAKAYLFERTETSEALVGSSNLSLPSPGNPTELNVLVRDEAAVQAVAAWFDTLWAASQDFSRDLFTEISSAWPFAAPGE